MVGTYRLLFCEYDWRLRSRSLFFSSLENPKCSQYSTISLMKFAQIFVQHQQLQQHWMVCSFLLVRMLYKRFRRASEAFNLFEEFAKFDYHYEKRSCIIHLAPIDFPCQKHINHSVNRLEWEKLRFIGRIFFSTAAVNEEIFHANIFVHIFHGSLKIRFLRLEWTKKTGRNVMLHVCYQTHIVLVCIYFMNIMFEFVVFLLFFKVYDNDCCYASVYRKI